MQRTWSIRAYRDGDEETIIILWRSVYPELEYDRDKWLSWWHWMYKENPVGKSSIWLAEDRGRIIGQSAVIPVMIKIGAKSILGFQSIDTMTHPDYRSQGIYQVLARKTYTEAEDEGMYIGYRFPNNNSHPIAIKKLNWFDISARRVLVKPLNWGNALKLRTGSKFLIKLGTISGSILQKTVYRAEKAPIVEGIKIAQVPYFDERINEFWARVSSQYPIMVVRNKDYLNWRYVAVPDTEYSIYIAEKEEKIDGYLILRPKQFGQVKLGVIFDILAQSQDIAQCLIAKAIEHCKQENVDFVSYSIIASKTYVNAFRKNGFISVPFVKDMWFCAYSSAPDISREFLKERKNWFVQTGDSDVL